MPIDEEKVKSSIIDVLKNTYDPEIPVNVYDLGLIYEVNVDKEGEAYVRMTLTSPNCPVAETMPPEIQQKIAEIEGVENAVLEVVWDPPWTKDMMTEAAKLELNLL